MYKRNLPLPPFIVLLPSLPSSTPALLDSTRPNPTRLLPLHTATRSRLPRTRKFIPEVLFILRGTLRRRSEALPEVFALGFSIAAARCGGLCGRVAFDEAVELCAGVYDAGLEGLAEGAGGGAGLGRDVCFGELGMLVS
jgi:hypothetical protein